MNLGGPSQNWSIGRIGSQSLLQKSSHVRFLGLVVVMSVAKRK